MTRVGATLYYKTQGEGPLLLILQGGDGDANGARAIANRLSNRYTVVSYDRRGLSHSSLTAGAEGLRLETHADDAHALLASLTTDPAWVLGMSLGALLGLDLVSRYPHQVGGLICHEPPATQVLPDADRMRAESHQVDIETAFREEGAPGAMRKFAELAGLDFSEMEPGVELPRPGPERIGNLTFFLTYDAPAVHQYRLDLAKLGNVKDKIVIAVGHRSGAHVPHHCALALAKQIGLDVEELPGGHGGFVTHPAAFASKVDEVFSRRVGRLKGFDQMEPV